MEKQFNNNWYIQKGGVAMGSPLAPSMATIFMNECETKLSNYEGIKPKFYRRYVDDIFAIFENQSQCTVDHFNFLCKKNNVLGSFGNKAYFVLRSKLYKK